MAVRMTLVMMGLVLLWPVTVAAGVEPGHIAPAAQWYAYVDVERVRNSPAGARVLERWAGADDGRRVARFEHWAGFHPMDDVDAALMYHDALTEDEGVLVLYGRFDPQRIVERIRLADEHQQVEVAGREAHRFRMPARRGERMVYAVVEASWLTLSSDRRAVAESVRLLRGEARGLEAGDALLAPQPAGTWLQWAVDLEGVEAHHKMVEALRRVHVTLAADDEQVMLHLGATADDAERAGHVADALQGLRAISLFRLEADAPVARLMRAVTIERDGPHVDLRASYPVDELPELLVEDWRQRHDDE